MRHEDGKTNAAQRPAADESRLTQTTRVSEKATASRIHLQLIASQFLVGIVAGVLAFFQGLGPAGGVVGYAWYGVLPLYALAHAVIAAPSTKAATVSVLFCGPFVFLAGFALTYAYQGILDPGFRQGLIAAVVSIAIFLLARRLVRWLAIVPASAWRVVCWTVPVLCLCLVAGLVFFPFRSDLNEFKNQRFRAFGSRFLIADDRVYVEGGGYMEGPDHATHWMLVVSSQGVEPLVVSLAQSTVGPRYVHPSLGTVHSLGDDASLEVGKTRQEMRGPLLRLLNKHLVWDRGVSEARVLLNRYAVPKDPGLNERLLRSVQAGELSALRDLLAKGADPNVTVNAFFPPKPPDRPGVLVFDEEKYTTADPGPSRRRGATTLLILGVPRIEIMAALLDGGARIDARNTSGATALLAAVELACVSSMDQTLGAVKLLVERGSDLAVRDAKGRSVSDLAACRMMPLEARRFLVPLIAEALKRK